MRYIAVKQPGETSVLTVATMAASQPGATEVQIKVAYAGVNRPDVFQRLGLYPAPPGASPILGLEVSGYVTAVGEQVDQFQAGDEVCALTNGGGYAQQVCVEQGQCLPKPGSLSMAEAAALPETFFTVYSNVFDRAGLASGEVLLVHAGASGIGTSAIQMASALGIRVLTTASSDKKCQACLALGADVAINYAEQDFVEQVKEATNGQGADVILDMVGGDYIQRNIQAAAVGGRIASIAFLKGAKAEVNFMPVMLKRLTLTGSTLRSQSSTVKARIAKQLRTVFWPLIEQGKIKPLLADEFSLVDANAAHALMESNHLIGKIVINMQMD